MVFIRFVPERLLPWLRGAPGRRVQILRTVAIRSGLQYMRVGEQLAASFDVPGEGVQGLRVL